MLNNSKKLSPFELGGWGWRHPFSSSPGIHPVSRGVAVHTAGLFRSVRGAKGGLEYEEQSSTGELTYIIAGFVNIFLSGLKICFLPQYFQLGLPKLSNFHFSPRRGFPGENFHFSPPWRLPKLGNFHFSPPWGLPKRGNFHFSPVGASQAKNFHFPPPWGLPKLGNFHFSPVGASQAREFSLFPPWGLPKRGNFHFSPVGASQAKNFHFPPVGAPQAREFSLFPRGGFPS